MRVLIVLRDSAFDQSWTDQHHLVQSTACFVSKVLLDIDTHVFTHCLWLLLFNSEARVE